MPIKKKKPSEPDSTALKRFTDFDSDPAYFTLGLDSSADIKIVVTGCLF